MDLIITRFAAGVKGMTIHSLDVSSKGLSPAALHLDRYAESCARRLDAITLCARQGEIIEPEARYWIIEQIEFLVQTIGDARLELSEEVRSNLLDLLLAFANLHEHIRSREPAGSRLG